MTRQKSGLPGWNTVTTHNTRIQLSCLYESGEGSLAAKLATTAMNGALCTSYTDCKSILSPSPGTELLLWIILRLVLMATRGTGITWAPAASCNPAFDVRDARRSPDSCSLCL